MRPIILIGLMVIPLISCRAAEEPSTSTGQRLPLRMVDAYRAELQPASSVDEVKIEVKGVTTVADTLTDPLSPVISDTPLTVPTEAISAIIPASLPSMPAQAQAAEYLLNVRANGNDMGFFPATEKGGEVVIDRSLSEALGLPVQELTVTALQGYGRGAEVNIDLRRQELRIQSLTPFPFQSPVKGEAGAIDKIRPEEKMFALKSVDFAASHNYAPNYSEESQLFLAPSGRFLGGDLDIYYSGDGQPTRYKLGYRDEDREWLRSVDLGYLQHPVPFVSYSDKPALSISNIPLSRTGAMLENYYLSEPIGTRVEVWKEQAVITVYTIDTIPFLIPLPLSYSGNEYRLKIYRADGSIREVNISREIGQEQLRPGEINYYIAAQQEEAPLASVTLGVTNTLTLSAGITSGEGKTADPYTGARLSIPDGTVSGDISAAGNYIYRLNTTEGFSASHARTAATGNKDTIFTLTPNELPWSPSLTLRLLETPEMVSLTEQLRLFIPYQAFYFNPSIQVYDSEGYSIYGLQGYWFLGAEKLGIDLSYNTVSEQYDQEATWYHNKGSHQVEISAGERTQNKYLSLRYNYRPTAGLAVGATYRLSEADYSVGVQVSGSFIPAAQKVIPQAVAQSGLIFAKITDASTGKPLSGAISIDGITHNLSEEGQGLIPATPYQYHRVRVIPDFDYMAEGKSTFDLYIGKGDITRLVIKMVPIEEIDGYIEAKADGKTVKLLDETGAVVAEQNTRFNGYYYFRVAKKSLKYRVEVAEPKEVQIVKAD